MSGIASPIGKLFWEEIISSDEMRVWFRTRQEPQRLKRDFSIPGVYRFIFPEFKDGNGSHIACYVGQSGLLAGRVPFYFRPRSNKERRDKNGEIILPDGWHARGRVGYFEGASTLQVLKIEGAISFAGIHLNQYSFDNPFARVLLENWAIISSERTDQLRPTNRGISQSTLELLKRMAQNCVTGGTETSGQAAN